MSGAAVVDKKKQRIKHILLYILLIAVSVLILSPVWWMISTSLKTPAEIAQYPPEFFPDAFHFSNYSEAWTTAPFTRWTLNTIFVSVLSTLGSVFANAFIAYGFAIIRFKGKNFLFSLIMATMLIPGFVTLVPQYILFAKIGWVGTYLPLIVPSFLGSAFFIFLIRQFMRTIPKDMVEAARIDGANHFQIWWKIILPLVKPALITVAIFSFNGAWNDLIGPLLYLNDESMYTLQMGLQTFQSQLSTQWHYLMAMSTIVLMPMVLLFFFFQRYFIEGSNLTGRQL